MNINDEFQDLKSKTNGFKEITPELIMENPRFIRLLRSSTSLSHIQLGEIYMKRYGKVLRTNCYELGYEKPGRKMAKKLASIFTEVVEDTAPSLENIEAYSHRVNKAMDSFRKGAQFEKEIRVRLMKQGIPFQEHPRIKGKSGCLHRVDFAIPDRVNPQYLIEVKETRGLSGHDSINKARIIVSLAIDAPEGTKFIAAIRGRWSSNAMRLLENYCDKILTSLNEKDVLGEICETTL